MSRLNVDQIYTRTGTGTPALREMPAFRAYLSATQSITSSVITKVAIDTIDFDTNSWFDTANNRYVPQIAGYYKFDGIVKVTGTSQTQQISYLYKNGAEYSIGEINRVATSSSIHLNISDIVYLNGSTDYVELFGLVAASSGTSFLFGTTTNTSFFSGFLVRPD